MAQNADNISIVRPKTDGAAFTAPLDATTPTSASGALTGFDSMGLLAEAGITMTINRETKDLREMGGTVALTLPSGTDVRFKLKPMEWNEVVAKAMFGAKNVTEGVGVVKVTADMVEPCQYVFDMYGRGGKLIRVVVPNMQLISTGDFLFKYDEPMASEFDLRAMADENGVFAYIYTAESE